MKNILVVEDDRSLRHIIKEALNKSDFHIELAVDGVKAFEKITKNKFNISYKVANPNETQTICSNIDLLKKLLQIDIEKKEINDLISDYL